MAERDFYEDPHAYDDYYWGREDPEPAAESPAEPWGGLPPYPAPEGQEWIGGPGNWRLQPRGNTQTGTPGRYMDKPNEMVSPYFEPWGAPFPTGGGGGGGGWGSGTASRGPAPSFNWSSFPGYESAGPFKPRRDTFDFPGYESLTPEAAEKEPGYAFSRDQMVKRIENTAAAGGFVRSGRTLNDLLENINAFAGQNYDIADQRNFRNWGANRGAALEKFNTEFGIDRDIYDRLAADVGGRNTFNLGIAGLQNQRDMASFGDLYNRWAKGVDALIAQT